MSVTPMTVGEAAAFFHARSALNPRFAFDTLAGRWVLVMIPGSASAPGRAEALAAIAAVSSASLDPAQRIVVVLGTDPADEQAGRFHDGNALRVLWDDDSKGLRALRALEVDGTARPGWLLLDPSLRLFASWPLAQSAAAMTTFAALPPPEAHAGVPLHAPVLIVPRVFEPALCRRLIDLYDEQGGGESGFMRDVDGKTVGILDARRKRRKDAVIEDPGLQAAIRARLAARLLPEVHRAFQYKATRIERYIVACYDAADQGFFAAHRDDTTLGTAHRRFAVTINLNTGEYDGGDLCFPEFGPATYRAPAGGAVVFSCSLLHEARPVVRGQRYACLPFLYDEEAARIRQVNAAHLGVAEASRAPAPAAGS